MCGFAGAATHAGTLEDTLPTTRADRVLDRARISKLGMLRTRVRAEVHTGMAMSAIALFDAVGHPLQLLTCSAQDRAIADARGVRWGPRIKPAALRRWLGGGGREETLHLVPHLPDAARREIVSEEAGGLIVRHGVLLVWLALPEDHAGLLLEAGDGLYLPAGVPHAVDASGPGPVKVRRFAVGPRGWFARATGRRLPTALPDASELIDQLLAALGEDLLDEDTGPRNR